MTPSIRKALEFYADPRRYQGPNQRPIWDDKFASPDDVYIRDVTRDGGAIARSALSAPPKDVVEGIAQIVGYHLASVVSGNSQPNMSGDPRDRIPPVRRRHFDDGCAEAATAILASGLVTAAADNGDLNVADSPLYSKALNALRTAHEACFRSADRDVLGMSKGPFSGVNLALGIIKNLEKENTILKSMVLCAEAAIRADEREKCARVAERTPLNSYDAGECRADIAAAIRAGGDING